MGFQVQASLSGIKFYLFIYLWPQSLFHLIRSIRESTPDELLRPLAELALEHQPPPARLPTLALSQLFDPDACGRRVQTVVLYGTVGTGKSTLVRKMVLDWCYGRLPAFELLIPFSCEDLSSLGPAPASLCHLVAQRYTPLKEILPLMAAAGSRLLFVLHGLEHLNLNFQLAGTGLCSDPEEPKAPAAIMVNLLRKYMLPKVSGPLPCHHCPLTCPLSIFVSQACMFIG